jgi:hypothetical protein
MPLAFQYYELAGRNLDQARELARG